MERVLRAMAVVMVVGCHGAYRDHATTDGGTDAALVCGQATCDQGPAPACRDQDTLATYPASCVANACSYPETDVACGAPGCCGDHCCALAPSNGDVFGGLESNGLVVQPPDGTFDTDTGCTATSALGACTVVPRAGLGEACVCKMDALTIGTLRVTGARALVIFAAKSVDITKLLDVSGDVTVQGPGASKSYPVGMLANAGGAGGSFGTRGGRTPSTVNVAAIYGDPTLVPLYGGMAGQSQSAVSGLGGGGGGALQITAGERISVPGLINAGGGGGQAGENIWGNSGAGGGGSGGAILLEAPAVTVTGKLDANGGGGGGGGGSRGFGWNGMNGTDVVAQGGTGNDGDGCSLYGYVYGGHGGPGAFGGDAAVDGGASGYDSRCLGAASFVGEGGGGGGGGRIRVNSKTGCQCGGQVSPAASFGTVAFQ